MDEEDSEIDRVTTLWQCACACVCVCVCVPCSWSWMSAIGPAGDASANVATRSIPAQAAQHVTMGTLQHKQT